MKRVVSVLLAALAAASGAAEKFRGVVVAVTDGDTVKIQRSGDRPGRLLRIRLDGIDAPEMNQPYGTVAKRFASRAVLRRSVIVEAFGKDKYGRTLGRVTYRDGKGRARDLNLQLVRGGMAWWYAKYAPKAWKLMSAERSARKARRGLWVDPRPIAPWVWRHGGAVRHAIESGKARPGGRR